MIDILRIPSKWCVIAIAVILQVSCGGGGGSNAGNASDFELIHVGPLSEAKNQPLNQYARLVFNYPVDVGSVSKDKFGFFDITHLEESEDLVTSIPFRIELGENPSVVFLYPEIVLPENATIFVGVTDRLKASNGYELKQTSGFRFFTILDEEAPRLSSALPTVGDNTIGVQDSIVLSYNEPLFGTESDFISPNILKEKDLQSADWIPASNVETSVKVEGNTVTITPSLALNYGSDYTLSIGGFSFADEFGNRPFTEYKTLMYKTKPYPESIDLPFAIDSQVFDSSLNTIVGFSEDTGQFLKISLTDKIVITTHTLSETPSAYCLHESSDRIFATFENGEEIRVYDVSSMQQINRFDWFPRESTEDNQAGFSGFALYCAADELFVTSYRNSDQPWALSRIAIDAPHNQIVMQDSKDIANIMQLESGGYYVTERDFSASYFSIRHMQVHDDIFEELDVWWVYGNTDWPHDYPEKFEINFDTRHVFIANMIYALDNMPGRLRIFDNNETTMAFDPVRSRVYTNRGLYNLDGFDLLTGKIIPGSDLAQFDRNGNLILIDNEQKKLYSIDERVLSTTEFP